MAQRKVPVFAWFQEINALLMIAGSDKTVMQVAGGRKEHKPGNGISSAAGGGGGISGDPGGRVTDPMCKDVLSRHGGRPGNPGMVIGDHDGAGIHPTPTSKMTLIQRCIICVKHVPDHRPCVMP